MLRWLIPLTLISFGLAWWLTDGGQMALNVMNADVAHHLALIEAFVVDGGRSAGIANGNLAEMGRYPPLSHLLTTALTQLSGRSPIEAITVLATFWPLVICAAVAWRIAVALQPLRSRFWLFVALGLALATVYFGLMRIGLGSFGHVLWNYFYAQAAGTALAFGGLALLQHDFWRGRPWPTLGLIMVVTVVLLFTHAVPGLWFVGFAYFYFLSDGLSWRALGRQTAVYGGVMGVVVLLHPGTRAMLTISQNDGVYAIAARPFVNTQLIGFIAGGAIVLAAGLLLWLGRQRDLVTLRQTGPFLAIALLMGLNAAALWLFEASSWYSVMKYLIILALEWPVAMVVILDQIMGSNHDIPPAVGPQRAAALRSTRSTSQKNQFHQLINWASSPVVLATLFFLIQIPFNTWHVDQTPVIIARETLLPERYMRSDPPRTYPEGYGKGENYYLAVGVLGMPRDKETMDWFD